MRTRFLTFVSVCVCLLFGIAMACGETPAAGKQVAASTAVKVKSDEGEREVTLRYLIYLPGDYDAKPAERWPLVLFLHGAGERGDDIEKVKIHGPPKLVSQGKEFPFVLVSPQVPTGSRWNAEELSKLVDWLTNTYRIRTSLRRQCRCAAAAIWKRSKSWRRHQSGSWSARRTVSRPCRIVRRWRRH